MKFISLLLATLLLAGCSGSQTGSPSASSTPSAASSSVPSEAGQTQTDSAAESNTKATAWALGQQVSLASLGRSRGATDAADRIFKKAEASAQQLGLGELPKLPEATGDPAQDGAAALEYLLSTGGGQIVGSLTEKHNQQTADLFEMSAKANIAFMLYSTNTEDPMNRAMTGRLSELGESSQLPQELWKPVVEKMASGAPQKEVQQMLQEMGSKVHEHLVNNG